MTTHDQLTDWGLPESILHEAATSRAIAAGLRAEAERLRVEIAALSTSRWSCIEQAAAIERELRGLG